LFDRFRLGTWLLLCELPVPNLRLLGLLRRELWVLFRVFVRIADSFPRTNDARTHGLWSAVGSVVVIVFTERGRVDDDVR